MSTQARRKRKKAQKPQKPIRQVSLKIDRVLWDGVKQAAKGQMRSANNYVVVALTEKVNPPSEEISGAPLNQSTAATANRG